jgi:hypothetical protein
MASGILAYTKPASCTQYHVNMHVSYTFAVHRSIQLYCQLAPYTEALSLCCRMHGYVDDLTEMLHVLPTIHALLLLSTAYACRC